MIPKREAVRGASAPLGQRASVSEVGNEVVRPMSSAPCPQVALVNNLSGSFCALGSCISVFLAHTSLTVAFMQYTISINP